MKVNKPMFNLNDLAMADTTVLLLKHPVSDETLYSDDAKTKPASISLFGTSSKQYRNAIAAMQNRALKRGKKQATAEVMREESVELLAACSERGINFEYQGKPLLGASDFRALYSDPAFSWLKDQVDAAIGDTSNFLQA